MAHRDKPPARVYEPAMTWATCSRSGMPTGCRRFTTGGSGDLEITGSNETGDIGFVTVVHWRPGRQPLPGKRVHRRKGSGWRGAAHRDERTLTLIIEAQQPDNSRTFPNTPCNFRSPRIAALARPGPMTVRIPRTASSGIQKLSPFSDHYSPFQPSPYPYKDPKLTAHWRTRNPSSGPAAPSRRARSWRLTAGKSRRVIRSHPSAKESPQSDARHPNAFHEREPRHPPGTP